MNRLATPPAQVPTLTDIVHTLALPDPAQSVSIPVIALPQRLQKEIINRVVHHVGKNLKIRLREAGPETGFNRTQLVAFLCDGVEQAVGSAVEQALANPVQRAGVAPIKGQGRSGRSRPAIAITKDNHEPG